MNTVELQLPTLRLTQPQKSTGYAAVTNRLKLRLLSTLEEKSLAKGRLEKMRTSKVGALSEDQKTQNIFWQKNLKFLNFIFRKMSCSAKKCKKGDPFRFINIYCVANYQKTRRGYSLGTLKNFR